MFRHKHKNRRELVLKSISEIESVNVYLEPGSLKYLEKIKEKCNSKKQIADYQMKIINEIWIKVMKRLEEQSIPYQLYVYTDGFYDFDKRTGGFSFVILDSNKNEIFSTSRRSSEYSIPRMKIKGLIETLKWIMETVPNYKNVSILVQSNSDYLVNAYNFGLDKWSKNGWVTDAGTGVKNLDLITEMGDLKEQVPLLNLKVSKYDNSSQIWMDLAKSMAQESYVTEEELF